MKKRKWTEQKCWGCQKAGGGCTWSAEGEDGAIRFEPIPGWDAEQVPWRRYCNAADGYTYKIYDCPEFVPLVPTKKASKPEGMYRNSARLAASTPERCAGVGVLAAGRC